MLGISIDNEINQHEKAELENWVAAHQKVLTIILADKIISETEIDLLKSFFMQFVEKSETSNINFDEIENLKVDTSIFSLYTTDPEIVFKNKTFSATGEFEKSTKDAAFQIIKSLGGSYSDSITQTIDYLVYSGKGSLYWACSCSGRKVEEVLDLRKKGNKVQIIKESDFWSQLAH